MLIELTLLALAERAAGETEVIGVPATAVGDRRTTPQRIRTALAERARAARRTWLLEVIDDLAQGTCSVLEHRYLTDVERAHGLPAASRQTTRAAPSGRQYRDVEYQELGVVVELDGRVGHDTWDASGRDADRDLDDHAAGREAIRLRHAQVFDRACRTAERIAAVLARRGWQGSVRSCGPGCSLAA